MTTYILNIISLLGGLALFLFGMDVMGKALEQQAGSKLQTILAKMSSTVFKGFFLGVAVTAVIQSSSATTVMVVGFVNSGIMTLKQAVGVIMGANVGTTVTAWILSLSALEGDSLIVSLFKPSTLAPLMGIVGIVLYMFTKSDRKKGIGTILLGFMALMIGMQLMSDSMKFLKEEAWFANLMVSFSNPILGILAGAVLTALIQSSSASVGILQGLCATGLVTGGTALPIILGQNIGTCVTALISTVGANRNARRSAMIHLYFNIVGVIIFSLLFYGIGLFFPWAFLKESMGAAEVAILHTGFNVITTLVMLPLNGLLVKLANLTIPDGNAPQRTVLLDERLLVTPAAAIKRCQTVAAKMAQASAESVRLAIGLTKNYDPKVMDRIIELEDETDKYEDALGTYLVKLSALKLSVSNSRTLNTLLYSIADLERIADHAVSIARAGKEIADKNIAFSDDARRELEVLERAVNDVVENTVNSFTSFDFGLAKEVEPLDQVIDSLIRDIKSGHVRRLRDGLCSVEYGFVLNDLLTSYERTSGHCSNVAVELLQVTEGKLSAHGYLGALKAGELSESAEFNERLEKYKQRYALPQ